MGRRVISYVGVKNTTLFPLSKQDFFLFDQIVIPYLDITLQRSKDPETRAVLQWLAGEELVEDMDLKLDMIDEESTDFQMIALSMAVATFALLHSRPFEHTQEKILRDLISRTFELHLTRACANVLQSQHGVSSVPLLPFQSDLVRWDWEKNATALHKEVEAMLDSVKARLAADQSPDLDAILDVGRKVLVTLSDLETATKNESKLAKVPVLDIVLDHLPMPDETVSWEQIRDFVDDPDARESLLLLRRWMSTIATGEKTAAEIREELDYLLAQYRTHMKHHHMKVRPGLVQTVVTTTAHVAEHVAKLQFGKAADALFSVRQAKLALFEAERAAPGREVAYILKAGERFR